MARPPLKRILTGMRTTGAAHLGHYAGALRNWVDMQGEYECYFLLADVQAFSTHFDDPQRIVDSVYEMVLDWLAVGLDPTKQSNIFFVLQSQIQDLTELTTYFSMLTPMAYIERNPTIKSERAQYGERAANLGFYNYPVSQAADVLLFTPPPPHTEGDELCVPVGEDQLPLLELTNDIAGWFNRTYDRVFLECSHRLSEVPRLMGTDGQAKMSKSLGNVILLSDDAESVQKKVMSMYTDPTRLRATDPGHVEGNPVFMYHDAFNPDVAEVDELKDRYRKGRVGDVEVKRKLIAALNAMLDPIRERREAFAKDPDIVQEVLRGGIEQTRAVGGETMDHVRAAMYIDYPKLLAPQAATS